MQMLFFKKNKRILVCAGAAVVLLFTLLFWASKNQAPKIDVSEVLRSCQENAAAAYLEFAGYLEEPTEAQYRNGFASLYACDSQMQLLPAESREQLPVLEVHTVVCKIIVQDQPLSNAAVEMLMKGLEIFQEDPMSAAAKVYFFQAVNT